MLLFFPDFQTFVEMDALNFVYGFSNSDIFVSNWIFGVIFNMWYYIGDLLNIFSLLFFLLLTCISPFGEEVKNILFCFIFKNLYSILFLNLYFFCFNYSLTAYNFSLGPV